MESIFYFLRFIAPILVILFFIFLRQHKSTTIVVNVVLIFSIIIIPCIFRDGYDQWVFSKSDIRVKSVLSGNTFVVSGIFWIGRTFVLAETYLPDDPIVADSAKQALSELLLGKKVSITFALDKPEQSEPWPVYVRISDQNINKELIQKGILVGSPDMVDSDIKVRMPILCVM